jgi:LytS/YehU family sensor histidine kinase
MKNETKETVKMLLMNGRTNIFEAASRLISKLMMAAEMAETIPAAKRAFIDTETKTMMDETLLGLENKVKSIAETLDELIEEGLVAEDSKEQIVKNCKDCLKSIADLRTEVEAIVAGAEPETATENPTKVEPEEKEEFSV